MENVRSVLELYSAVRKRQIGADRFLLALNGLSRKDVLPLLRFIEATRASISPARQCGDANS
jgi:hypothetical protein